MDDEYEFWIDAYTPATIPMERLAKYLGVLAKMLGHASSVHFDRLEMGSTRSLMHVQREDAPKVFERVDHIAKRQAANDATSAFDELNSLLRDDSAIGKLSRKTPASQSAEVVLTFLGRELPKPPTFGPFYEEAVVEGELVRIGGKDKSAHALIVDPEGKAWSGEMERELAREMAQYLYKGIVLRVTGDARWERLADASWHLMVFKIKGFEVLADDTLDEATQRLRRLKKTDWDSVDDIDAFIIASRGESDGLH